MRVLYTFIIAILLPLLLSAQNQKETYTLNLNRYYAIDDLKRLSKSEAAIIYQQPIEAYTSTGVNYLEVPHNIRASLFFSEYDIKNLSKEEFSLDENLSKYPILKERKNWIEILEYYSKGAFQLLSQSINFGETVNISKDNFNNNGNKRFLYLCINIPDDIRAQSGKWMFDDENIGKLSISSYYNQMFNNRNNKGVLGIHIGEKLNYNNLFTDVHWKHISLTAIHKIKRLWPFDDEEHRLEYPTKMALSSDQRMLIDFDNDRNAYCYLFKITMDDFDENGNLKISFGFKDIDEHFSIRNLKTKVFSEIKTGKGSIQFHHRKKTGEEYKISNEVYINKPIGRDEDFGIEVTADDGYEIDNIEIYSYHRKNALPGVAPFLNVFDKFKSEHYSSKGNFIIHIPKEQSISTLKRLRSSDGYISNLSLSGKYVVSFRPIKYDVLLSNSLNGNIELSKKGKVDKGTKVYIKNINPADGYKLDKILINERELNEDFFIVNENTKVEALFVFEEDKVMNIENTSYGADIFSSYEIRELEDTYKVKYGKIDISTNDGFILKDIKVKCKNSFEYNGNKLISNGEWISLKSIDAEIFSSPKDNYEIGLFDKETIVRLSFEYSSSVKFRKLVIKESPLGEIIVRDNKTGEEYKKGTIKLPLNSKLILSSNYDKSKYTLRGFMVNGIKLRGYTLTLVEDTELSIDLEDISETNSLSKLEVEVEKLENGSYRLYMPVEYIDKDLRIYDSLGNLIENHKIESSISEISLWNLPSGIYLIKIEKTVIKIKHKNN